MTLPNKPGMDFLGAFGFSVADELSEEETVALDAAAVALATEVAFTGVEAPAPAAWTA